VCVQKWKKKIFKNFLLWAKKNTQESFKETKLKVAQKTTLGVMRL